MEWKQYLIPALATVGMSLLMGRTFKRLILAPFKWLASKTENKFDDQLEQDAEKDLGIDGE